MKVFNEYFKFFFYPLIPFMIYDVITTYIGVCVMGGFEIQSWATYSAVNWGFIPTIILYFLIYGFGCFMMSYFYKKLYDKEIWRVFIIVGWSLMFMEMLKTTILNANSLFFQVTSYSVFSPETFTDLTKEQLIQISNDFTPVKNIFCRLI